MGDSSSDSAEHEGAAGLPPAPYAPTPVAAAAVPGAPPGGVETDPRWRWWQGLLGLGTGFTATLIVGAAIASVAVVAGAKLDPTPPGLTIALTLVQDACLIGAALAFAAMSGRPRLVQFGLRRTALWSTLGWMALGALGFIVFSVTYQLIVDPQGEQTTADDLGVNKSVALLLIGGFVTIVLAPITEELFFRGFFYRSLRNSLGGALGRAAGTGLAALSTSAVFTAAHLGSTPVAVLPILLALGITFCLVYERTGSLFAVIGLHALQNMFGFVAVAKNGLGVALGFGAAMVLGCLLIPRLLKSSRRSRAAPATAA